MPYRLRKLSLTRKLQAPTERLTERERQLGVRGIVIGPIHVWGRPVCRKVSEAGVLAQSLASLQAAMGSVYSPHCAYVGSSAAPSSRWLALFLGQVCAVPPRTPRKQSPPQGRHDRLDEVCSWDPPLRRPAEHAFAVFPCVLSTTQSSAQHTSSCAVFPHVHSWCSRVMLQRTVLCPSFPASASCASPTLSVVAGVVPIDVDVHHSEIPRTSLVHA